MPRVLSEPRVPPRFPVSRLPTSVRRAFDEYHAGLSTFGGAPLTPREALSDLRMRLSRLLEEDEAFEDAFFRAEEGEGHILRIVLESDEGRRIRALRRVRP